MPSPLSLSRTGEGALSPFPTRARIPGLYATWKASGLKRDITGPPSARPRNTENPRSYLIRGEVYSPVDSNWARNHRPLLSSVRSVKKTLTNSRFLAYYCRPMPGHPPSPFTPSPSSHSLLQPFRISATSSLQNFSPGIALLLSPRFSPSSLSAVSPSPLSKSNPLSILELPRRNEDRGISIPSSSHPLASSPREGREEASTVARGRGRKQGERREEAREKYTRYIRGRQYLIEQRRRRRL